VARKSNWVFNFLIRAKVVKFSYRPVVNSFSTHSIS